jgi:hypothetical protein
MKRILFSIIIILGTAALHAQDFFADERNNDTIPKRFYEHKYHGTLFYTMGGSKYLYGGSILLHYNKEKFSPYFEFRFNPSSTTNYLMINKTTHDSSNNPLTYRTYNISVGMAASPRKNVLLYANVGVRYLQSLYDRSMYSRYFIKDKDNEINLIYGGGIIYVFPFGLSAQLGVDLSKFTVITGLGYTF